MRAQPYLMFNGRCDEAIAFYQAAVRAEVAMLTRFKDAPDPKMREHSAAHGDKVMHACLRIGDTTVFASDGRCTGTTKFEGFGLSLTVDTEAECDDLYAKLAADGGTSQMPPSKTFWSPKFGMLTDKFGVGWMVMVEGM